MIRDMFIGWIAFQLIVIGLGGGSHYAQINNGTLDCSQKDERVSEVGAAFTGALLPLLFFTNVEKGCK